jgi:hypothetical protein
MGCRWTLLFGLLGATTMRLLPLGAEHFFKGRFAAIQMPSAASADSIESAWGWRALPQVRTMQASRLHAKTRVLADTRIFRPTSRCAKPHPWLQLSAQRKTGRPLPRLDANSIGVWENRLVFDQTELK